MPAVLFGVNMGFALSTETNLLVLNADRYEFRDFVKVGSVLTLLMWIVFSFAAATPVWLVALR